MVSASLFLNSDKSFAMTTLYLVRHGELPTSPRFSPRRRLPLSPTRAQFAAQTADFFASHAIDAVYSSPLRRAHRDKARRLPPVWETRDRRGGLSQDQRGVLEDNRRRPNSGTDTTSSLLAWFAGEHDHAPSKGANRTTTCGGGRRAGYAQVLAEVPGRAVIFAHGGLFP